MSRRSDVAFAAGACVVLAGYNNFVGRRPWHRRWYPVVNGGAAAALLGAALASGLSVSDVGLGRDRLGDGLRYGSAAAVPVAAAYGVAVLTPAIRPLLDDQRVAGLDRRQLAYQVLLRIPVGTVAWEEIAFRGVLQASLRRVVAEPWARAVGAAVFGVWHIRPTAEALAVNGLATGRGPRILAVTGVVAGTAGAGAVLSLLRERSGSLAAPVLLHLTANCTGPLASALSLCFAHGGWPWPLPWACWASTVKSWLRRFLGGWFRALLNGDATVAIAGCCGHAGPRWRGLPASCC